MPIAAASNPSGGRVTKTGSSSSPATDPATGPAIPTRRKVNAAAGTIDGAPIIVTNVPASNGIIHAVGAVLLP